METNQTSTPVVMKRKYLIGGVIVALVLILSIVIMYVVNGGQLFGIGGQTGCTMEAKLCPDGSSVGRSGPKCEFAPCPTGTVNNSSLTIRSLYSGTMHYNNIQSQEFFTVINQAEYNDLMTRLSGTTSKLPLPEVDFTTEMVLIALAGQKSSGGYSIEIKSATLSGRTLTVQVEISEPGKYCITTEQLTYPQHVVAVPLGDYQPDFKVTTKTVDCSQ